MRRPSNTPVTVLAIGICSIALFGVGLIHFSSGSPILRLRPALEKELGIRGVQTRFVPGAEPSIEVTLPATVEVTPDELMEHGFTALRLYREMARQTRVRTCRVSVRDRADLGAVLVDAETLDSVRQARRDMAQMVHLARQHGLKNATVEIVSLLPGGVRLLVKGKAESEPEQRRARLVARKVSDRLAGLPYVAEARVRIDLPAGAYVEDVAPRVREPRPVDGGPLPEAPSASPSPSPSAPAPVATPAATRGS